MTYIQNKKGSLNKLSIKNMEKWTIYAIISMVFAGITSVIAKFGMKDLSSDTALTIRTSVVFSIIIANAFLFRNAYLSLEIRPKIANKAMKRL